MRRRQQIATGRFIAIGFMAAAGRGLTQGLVMSEAKQVERLPVFPEFKNPLTLIRTRVQA